MSNQTKYFPLNSEPTLQEASELPITIHGVNLLNYNNICLKGNQKR